MTTAVRHEFVAFMEDPDNPDIPNVIHSTDAARDYGFEAALVGGVTAYGWTVPAIREALGDRWLEDGWLDLHLRRPIYPDDPLTIVVRADGDGFALTVSKAEDECVMRATLGLGSASWAGELERAEDSEPRPVPASLPRLTPDNTPVGHDLRPMAVPLSSEAATRYAVEQEADGDPLWAGSVPRIHPSWLAARATPFLHHSFDYGPSIHTRSQIQHLGPASAGQTFSVSGTFVDTFERKGHHYAVVDCLIRAEDGAELAAIRHTTIFQVAKRPQP
jgi:hypothetical protein